MKINKARALKAFKDYTANYDLRNISITLKIAHTYRVAAIAERIAKSIFTEEDKNSVDFAWLLGLLHDIGRFEQVTRYGTFKDALSIDHAELGADILFNSGLFDTFVVREEADLTLKEFQRVKAVAETAIRLHNKLRLPENLDTQTMTYAKILRDADKADIFRVLTEPPYNERNLKELTVRAEIMQCVREHRCVPRPAGKFQFNELESLISQCCMAFELEYQESRNIVNEQGYLKELLEQDADQLVILKTEIMKAYFQSQGAEVSTAVSFDTFKMD